MLNNVKKRSKSGPLGDNKGVSLTPKVWPKRFFVDYSRDIATLLLAYFRNIRQFAEKKIFYDPTWCIFNTSESMEALASISSDIPGCRPVGYADAKSPVRERTFGEVAQALMTLRDDHPDEYTLLLDQLDEKDGSVLDASWNRVAQILKEIDYLKSGEKDYGTVAKHLKKQKLDCERHERILKAIHKERMELEEEAPKVMLLYHRVLDAAAKLKPMLW
jgi:hypothetical protein